MTNYMPAVLQGLAVGDALGVPWEQGPKNMGVRNPERDRWDGAMKESRLGPAGTTSDDTGMAATLAKVIVREDHYIRLLAADAYLEWYRREGHSRGIGGTLRKALETYEQDRDVTACGVREFPGGYTGNGGAMRVAPLGLRYHQDVPELKRKAADDASLTHNCLEAQAGSVAVALAVAKALFIGAAAPFEATWRLLPTVLGELEGTYRYTRTYSLLLMVNDFVGRVAADQVSLGTGALTATPWPYSRLLCRLGVDGDVAATVATALLCASLPPIAGDPQATFRQGVLTAVRGLGDADTRAAITGAILGARYGEAGLPLEWVGVVEGREELRALDRGLWDRATGQPAGGIANT